MEQEALTYCVICGKPFCGSGRICSDDCRAERQRRYAQKYKENKPELPPKICVWCGKEFVPRMKTSVVCSDECRLQHKRQLSIQRHKAKADAARAAHVCIVCGKQDERTLSGMTECQKCRDLDKKLRRIKKKA